MRLYKLISGTLLEMNDSYFLGPELDWDDLLGREQLPKLLAAESQTGKLFLKKKRRNLFKKDCLPLWEIKKSGLQG